MIGLGAESRELTEADAPAVADLFVRCADYFLLQDGVMPEPADAVALFADVPPEKAADDQVVLGWRDDRGLYAVAAVLRDYPDDGIWYLGLLLVDGTRRRLGIGRSLYEAIEAWAAARGARHMRLAVLEANVAGECFWRALGFEEIRRVGPDKFKEKRHCRVELSRSTTRRFSKFTLPR
ncbi:GNAT family N-acetyltransferase [uncultured Sphingomonas sp.]|uniref:GNAT family N-acetyltransferase n=1 Tax=uncultured Sphingomonas sp. TaxID=158754 RepID=UPI0025EE48D6|nr:GNAT family N-acetyltransferase [uncultured Sphingomonas sp.]